MTLIETLKDEGFEFKVENGRVSAEIWWEGEDRSVNCEWIEIFSLAHYEELMSY